VFTAAIVVRKENIVWSGVPEHLGKRRLTCVTKSQRDAILIKTSFTLFFVRYNNTWILNNEVKSFYAVHKVRAAYLP